MLKLPTAAAIAALSATLLAQTRPAAEAPATRPAWRDAFDRVYSLTDGQVLKYVPSPFIPERADYFRDVDKSTSDAAFPFHAFLYDRGILTRGEMESTAGPTGVPAEAVIRACARISTQRIIIDPKLLNVSVAGDWIVQEQASPDEVLAAYAQILNTQFHTALTFQKHIDKQRLVIEVTGNYAFLRLPDSDLDCIQAFSDKMDHPKPGDRIAGGGTTSPQEFWAIMETYLDLPIIDDSKNEPGLLPFMLSWSLSDTTKRPLALANLARQTGLTLQLQNRDLPLWKTAPLKPQPKPTR